MNVKISKLNFDLSPNDISYLISILELFAETGKIRRIDLARKTSFKKSTITQKISSFINKGILQLNNNKELEFTEKGKELAEYIDNQISSLKDGFVKGLDLDGATALRIAKNIVICTEDKLIKAIV